MFQVERRSLFKKYRSKSNNLGRNWSSGHSKNQAPVPVKK